MEIATMLEVTVRFLFSTYSRSTFDIAFMIFVPQPLRCKKSWRPMTYILTMNCQMWRMLTMTIMIFLLMFQMEETMNKMNPMMILTYCESV